ncbi:MAG: hypothetical protein MI743_04620 [Sneathiellales bacterium]|nr:hypothetical protein [Sneathiellales bacterium]
MSNTVSQLEIYRAKAVGSNVNAVTLLATDYLNHFNEALMLAELVVDMPDMLDDFATWMPKHYKDHFRESGIADKDLAIEAFDHSPSEYKEPFDSSVQMLNKQLALLQQVLQKERENLGDPDKQQFVRKKCQLIRSLIDKISGIINGQVSAQTATTAEKTDMSEENSNVPSAQTEVIEVSEGEMLDQADIDALFD